MPVLKNRHHETFAQSIANGEEKGAAYSACYPRASRESALHLGHRLSRRAAVAARIHELQVTGGGEAVWLLTQRLRFLRDIALTPYSEIDERSPLCQAVHHGAHGVEYRLPDKRAALALYCKWAGDFQPRAKPPTALGRIISRIRATPYQPKSSL